MPKLTLRRGLLAAAAIGLLLSPAPAQDKPPLNTHPIVERDPFTNTIPGNPDFRRKTDQQQPTESIPKESSNTDEDTQTCGFSDEVDLSKAPEVQVTGIVSNSQGRQAILKSSSSTFIVSVGQKIGDFQVSSITPESVTLSYQGGKHKFTMNPAF